MPRPGIMLYFDILEPIKVLPDSDKGRLFVAMLEYGETGKVPEFEGMLALAWGFVKPKIDKDKEAYEESCAQRAYASFCRERKKLKLPKIPFEEWCTMDEYERTRMISVDGDQCPPSTDDIDRHLPITDDNSRYPTTTTTTTTSTTTSTTTAAATTATTTAKSQGSAAAATAIVKDGVKPFGGELGKGVVFLTDEQTEDLLNRMGLETFQHYMEQLSGFILREGARPKNHYETILKWWSEDSSI